MIFYISFLSEGFIKDFVLQNFIRKLSYFIGCVVVFAPSSLLDVLHNQYVTHPSTSFRDRVKTSGRSCYVHGSVSIIIESNNDQCICITYNNNNQVMLCCCIPASNRHNHTQKENIRSLEYELNCYKNMKANTFSNN